MKRIFSIFAILVLVALVVGCSSSQTDVASDDLSDTVDDTSVVSDTNVQTQIDDLVVGDDDEVELGELI